VEAGGGVPGNGGSAEASDEAGGGAHGTCGSAEEASAEAGGGVHGNCDSRWAGGGLLEAVAGRRGSTRRDERGASVEARILPMSSWASSRALLRACAWRWGSSDRRFKSVVC
jgi:hypothetical protein